MKPSLLFLVASDPRTSARPAEAIRIAAGVGAWQKATVRLYLRDEAVLALSEFTDELIDEDNFTRYLPMLRDAHPPVWVQKGNPLLAELGEPAVPFAEIDDAQLARHCAESNHVLRF